MTAATPDELLDKALELFHQAQYEEAQEVLLEVDRDELTAERKRQRDELAKEIGPAINQSGKAAQNLADAAKAVEAG
ncbi:MAG: hypothetical protein KAT44_03820, partial [Pirellulales bacterium]|nr:hypothetical protein [Pirellulales bacterium]